MVVEPELEGDCSLADVLLVLGVGVHLGFVHQAGDLAPSLERAHPPAASTVAAGVLHVLLSLHQLGVVGCDEGLHVGAGGVTDLNLLVIEQVIEVGLGREVLLEKGDESSGDVGLDIAAPRGIKPYIIPYI